MALEQTLAALSSSTKSLFFFNRKSNSQTNRQFLSLSPSVPYSLVNNKQLRFTRQSLKCSVGESYSSHMVSYPKPSEVPWKKELCNSVSLIGIVGNPIEIKHLPSGKTVAWTRLAVKKSSTDTSWISLTFWDELANIASQHVEKGNQIYVSGRLVSDTVESDDGKLQTYYKVVVQQLNFVERSSSSLGLYDRDSNPMVTGRKVGNNATNGMGSIEESWQAFFVNPVDWWDNRKNKKNPKYPDFKHKDTGEALWVEGRNNPPWVKSQLAILDTRMGSLHDRDSDFISSTGDYLSF